MGRSFVSLFAGPPTGGGSDKWKDPVDTPESLNSIENPDLDSLVLVSSENAIYRYDGTEWVTVAKQLPEAAKLKDTVNIRLIGDVSGYTYFDGSQDVVIATTIEPPWNEKKFNNVFPSQGSEDINSSSEFVLQEYFGNHTQTQIQVASDINFTAIIWDQTFDGNILNIPFLEEGQYAGNVNYYWRYRYFDDIRGWCDWSEPTMFKTEPTPFDINSIVIGDFIEGGYFAGVIDTTVSDPTNGLRYAVIIAPKALGDTSTYWKTSDTHTNFEESLWNGLQNTQRILAESSTNHPAANWANNLVINDYNDWYLPAVDELELIYRSFRPGWDANTAYKNASWSPYGSLDKGDGYNPSSDPIGTEYTKSPNVPGRTNFTIFQLGNTEALEYNPYYTSNQTTDARYVFAQHFRNGQQTGNGKSTGSGYRARAVRRVEF